VLALNTLLRRQVRAQTARLEAELVHLKRAEEELALQRRFFESLTHTLPEPVWLNDRAALLAGKRAAMA
jgi:hypothetical protein